MLIGRIVRTALLVAAMVGSSPVAAQAAWRAEDIPGSEGGLPPVRSVAFDREGRALVLFEGFSQSQVPQRFSGVAVRGPDGTWSRAGDIAGIGWGSAQALLYGRTRALLLTRQVSGFGRFHRARFRLVWAIGRSDGSRFGSFRRIAASASVPAAAANPAGDALVAFTSQLGSVVRVSRRRAGGDFGPVSAVGRGTLPVVAMDARGDAVVAWIGRRGVLRVRVRPVGGGWGRAQRVPLGRVNGDFRLRAVISANGRAVLAWESVIASEGGPARVAAHVAVRARGGRWRTATLERATLGTGAFAGDPAAIPFFDARGRLLVAFTAVRGGGTGVAVADVSESAQITAVASPSGASITATLDDAAAGPTDRVGVSWSEHDAVGGIQTFAALRSGGTWGAPAGLGAPGQAGLTGSRIAFSPVSGEALVVRAELTGRTPRLAASSSEAG
jgi:hypothetical protein